MIEDLTLEQLEKAVLSADGIQSILELPARAVRKIEKGVEPPVKEFKASDCLK